MDYISQLLLICPLLLVAGIIDGVSGGGGIIALPAYIMAGLPLNIAYGCNKMQSCLGTAAGLLKYLKNGFVDIKIALLSSITAILGSHISTEILLTLDDSVIKTIIIVALTYIITLTLLVNRIKSGTVTRVNTTKMTVFYCLIIGIVLGLYDGFFGPGGGTVALMLFTLIFKYDMRSASGNGKVIIVISNFIALISHLINGNVLFKIAIPATVANIIGSYIGAAMSVKGGNKIVRKFTLAVVIAVVIQAVTKLI